MDNTFQEGASTPAPGSSKPAIPAVSARNHPSLAIVVQTSSWPGGSSATVRLQMEVYYWTLFKEVKPQTEHPEDRLIAAVQTIVWGGLCIEALLNERCRHFLFWRVQPHDQSQVVWETLERSPTREKMEMLLKLCKRSQASEKTILKRLAFVEALRNRMVHFKDEPTPLTEQVMQKLDLGKGAEEIAIWDAISRPPTALERDLLSPACLERFRRYVKRLYCWLNRTDRYMHSH